MGKDDKDVRIQQVSAHGVPDDAEIYAPYGMSYNLPEGCLCLHIQLSEDEGDVIILPDRSKDRVKDLKRGEVAFFNPLTKTRTIYRQNGNMEIVTEGDKGDFNLTVKGVANMVIPTTNWTGDINLTGDINQTGGQIVSGDVTASGISLVNHTHAGSPTAPSGPVSNTGAAQ